MAYTGDIAPNGKFSGADAILAERLADSLRTGEFASDETADLADKLEQMADRLFSKGHVNYSLAYECAARLRLLA